MERVSARARARSLNRAQKCGRGVKACVETHVRLALPRLHLALTLLGHSHHNRLLAHAHRTAKRHTGKTAVSADAATRRRARIVHAHCVCLASQCPGQHRLGARAAAAVAEAAAHPTANSASPPRALRLLLLSPPSTAERCCTATAPPWKAAAEPTAAANTARTKRTIACARRNRHASGTPSLARRAAERDALGGPGVALSPPLCDFP